MCSESILCIYVLESNWILNISALGDGTKSRKGNCPETEVELAVVFLVILPDELQKSGQARWIAKSKGTWKELEVM